MTAPTQEPENPVCRLSRRQVAEFCDYLAAMLSAGLTLTEGLDECSLSHGRTGVSRLAARLAIELRAGSSFDAAVHVDGLLLPPLFQRLVTMGERSGSLGRALREASVFLREGDRARGAVLGAAAYPLVVLLVLVGFMFALQLLLVPGGLPALTALPPPLLVRLAVIRSTARAEALAVAAAAALVPIVGVLLVRLRSGEGTFAPLADRLLLAVPLAGRLIAARELRLFTAALESFSAHNLSVEQALFEASGLLRGLRLRSAVRSAAGRIEGGCPASRALASEPEIPDRLRRAVAVGDRAGSLSGVLPSVIEHYRWESERCLRRVEQLAEPLLVGLCGAVVVTAVVTVVLPMFALFGDAV